MATYQGPHVAVTQVFQTNPPAIAVENLPSAVIGTAYDVYEKELLDTHYGFFTSHYLSWPVTKVIYDETVLGNKEFDFYPATIFAQTTEYGDIELDDIELTSTTVHIAKDDMFALDGFEVVAGSSNAIMPYYTKTGSATDIVLDADAQTITMSGATFVTAELCRGLNLYTGIQGTAASFVKLGTVLTVGPDETKVKLSRPTATLKTLIDTHDTMVVGAMVQTSAGVEVTTAISYASLSKSAFIYDPDADFTVIKPGDIVEFSSTSLAADETVSIQAVINKNTLLISTATATETDISRYKACTVSSGVTIDLTSYTISRLIGFSQDYDLHSLNGGTGVQIHANDTGSLSFDVYQSSDGGPHPIGFALQQGDVIVFSLNHVAPSVRTVSYRIDTIVFNPEGRTNTTSAPLATTVAPADLGSWTITVGEKMYVEPAGTTSIWAADVAGDVFLHAWQPKIETSIVADFRAVNTDELGVVKRITSSDDIGTAWANDGAISVYNELAFMASIIRGLNGGRVMYGVNVDPTATGGISSQYSDALDELKMYDVYSHCLGTTNSGVNGLMSAYCDEQADPYEGHERIAVLAYDEDDVYLQGTDTGSNTITGTITLDGTFNPITGGVQADDVVDIYTAAGVFIEQVTVTDTPSTPATVETDGAIVHAAGTIYKFRTDRKEEQAQKIALLGDIGNRRVSVVWPGWFYAENDDVRINVPPYYITAAVAGLDGGVIVSQSFTNYGFAIPGLSNIELNTSTYFRKSQLDTIAGGGVDIMVQSASITQTISSRHDLTTNMDAVEYRERSITKQADVVAKTLRSSTAPYVGKYNITNQLISFLGQVCSIAQATLVKTGVVAKVETISIKQDENVVDKINFNIKTTVFVAGNYYDITLLVVSR